MPWLWLQDFGVLALELGPKGVSGCGFWGEAVAPGLQWWMEEILHHPGFPKYSNY